MRFIGIILLTLVCSFAAFAQNGKPLAQDFSAVTMNGDEIELGSLKGKVVLLTFWSTRCQICHAEIPKLNRLAAQYKGKNVVFLAPTMEAEAKVEAYTKNNPFDFEILPNSFGLVLKYADKDGSGNVNMGFPAYFLINQRGEIEQKAMGWDKINSITSQIDKLLNSN
ncbi:MAG TPA: TlpA disulfide reductase family protein [Pyrinomonadaceae bacterium]|nr:TlpA disulfide reductase family protein [Pyrinomonadaceae bacterium]